MDTDTVDLLLQTLGEALKLAADSQLKLVALERTLEKRNDAFCEAWRKEIEHLRKQRAYELNLSAIDNLRAKLVRE